MRHLLFILAAAAGVLGAAGVGAAAAAAHLGGGQLLDTAATFLMIHAAAVLAISALAQRASPWGARLFALAALLLILGMILFCGDFAMRALAERALFRMAALTGGTLLVAGWLFAAAAAALAAASRESASPDRPKLDNNQSTCVCFEVRRGRQASEEARRVTWHCPAIG